MNRVSTWPLERTLQIIGGRWKLYIICHLEEGAQRLSQLQRAIPGISQKVLIQQLRELEEHGLVSRTVFPEVPARVEYQATALGLSLMPIIHSLQLWGIHHGTAQVMAVVKADGYGHGATSPAAAAPSIRQAFAPYLGAAVA